MIAIKPDLISFDFENGLHSLFARLVIALLDAPTFEPGGQSFFEIVLDRFSSRTTKASSGVSLMLSLNTISWPCCALIIFSKKLSQLR
jgi:hypothetical protein